MRQILVVDDNLANLKQISAHLSGTYGVMLAKSGAQALAICERETPDLVLLDIEMPDMNGFETIERLKDSDKLSSIPVIFLSANHDIESEVKALSSGAMDFISKPVEKNILLHRIDLHLELHNYQNNLQHTLVELENNTIIAFSDLIDCKEQNSGDHAMRTSIYVRMIGNELLSRKLFADELSNETVEMMSRAAPLHDIGKIGVSDSILLKPGLLSDEERAAVRKHTSLGSRVLMKIYEHLPSQRYLDYAIKMAEGHHERWDGLGYPKGLKGDEIPLCCRIIAAANEYDSRMIDRVYRKGCSREEAMNAIRTESGKILDPIIAEVTESLSDKFASVEVKQKRLFLEARNNLI